MSERQPDHSEDPSRQGPGHDDADEHAKGSLTPAPTTPTEEKAEPEAGTGSADKRSPESKAEQDAPPSGPTGKPGAAGGDITR
jgi:hypothetical protein